MNAQINTLKLYFNTLGWLKFFFPRQLKLAPEQPDSTPLTIVQDTFKSIGVFWPISLWFFSGLRSFVESPEMRACHVFYDANLLTDAVVMHQNLNELLWAFHELNQAGVLLNPASRINFKRKTASQESWNMADALVDLRAITLFTTPGAQTYVDCLMQHATPKIIINGLYFLKPILTTANFYSLIAHQSPTDIKNALEQLDQNGLLQSKWAQNYFNKLMAHTNPSNLAPALLQMNQAGLFSAPNDTRYNFNELMAHNDLDSIQKCLTQLNRTELLRDSFMCRNNYENVIHHDSPQALASVLLLLNQTHLLDQTNFNPIIWHTNLWELSEILQTLHAINLLNTLSEAQSYLDLLLKRKSGHLYILRKAISTLKTAGLLASQADAEANMLSDIIAHDRSDEIASLFVQLNNLGLLNDVRRHEILHHGSSGSLTRIFSLLTKSGHQSLLTETRVNRLIAHKLLYVLYDTLSLLLEAGLLDTIDAEVNIDAVITTNNLNNIANTLNNITQLGLLKTTNAQANVAALFFHTYPAYVHGDINHLFRAGLLNTQNAQVTVDTVFIRPSFASALVDLYHAGLLDTPLAQAYRNALTIHQNPHELGKAFKTLHASGLLDSSIAQACFDAVQAHQTPSFLVNALVNINQAGLLDCPQGPMNLNKAIAHPNPDYFSRALIELNKTDLLKTTEGQSNFDAFIAHNHAENAMTKILFTLVNNTALLRTQETKQANFIALITHPNARGLLSVLSSISTGLFSSGLLPTGRGQSNFNAIVTHNNPESAGKLLYIMSGLLYNAEKQANFNLIMRYAHAMRMDPVTSRYWSRIPPYQISQARWMGMVACYANNENNPIAARQAWIQYVVQEFPGLFVENELDNHIDEQLNNSQSTHTASVHKSVSESATRLVTRYGKALSGSNLDNLINTITTWVDSLPNENLVNKTAKRCIQRLTAPNYAFTDRVSQVSTYQLLGLIWLAIHDEEARIGTLEDAKTLFLEAFYEIQRGYNLVKTGEDRSICIGGTFNKLLEKLATIHPDVRIIFITKATAALKLAPVVREESYAYLLSLPSPTTPRALHYFSRLLSDAEDIWSQIKDKISTRMFEDFGSLYQTKENPAFTSFIDAGVYTSLPCLPALQEKIAASEGYRQYCSNTLMSFGLFSKLDKNKIESVVAPSYTPA